MQEKYFLGWLAYESDPNNPQYVNNNAILSKKMEYWWIRDFCKDSKHIFIFTKFLTFLVKYVGQIDTQKPKENVLFIPGGNLDLFSNFIPNNFTTTNLPQNSYALISAFSSSKANSKLNHMFTARFDQYRLFTQVKYCSEDGLLYCNALDSVAVLNFDCQTGFAILREFKVLNGDLIKDFFLFGNGGYKNEITEDNEKVFAYLDQFDKVKFKFK